MAVGLALTRGELPDRLAALLHQLLDRSTDTLLGPAPDRDDRCSGWWSRKYIRNLVLAGESDTLTENADGSSMAGARTAGRWMATLAELGWVEAVHRHRIVNGEIVGTSNLWRLRIPDHLRAELHDGEDTARAARAGNRPKRGRPDRASNGIPPRGSTNRQGAAAARLGQLNDDRRAAPCPTCAGNLWVPAPGGVGVVYCWDCAGTGTTRAGP